MPKKTIYNIHTNVMSQSLAYTVYLVSQSKADTVYSIDMFTVYILKHRIYCLWTNIMSLEITYTVYAQMLCH